MSRWAAPSPGVARRHTLASPAAAIFVILAAAFGCPSADDPRGGGDSSDATLSDRGEPESGDAEASTEEPPSITCVDDADAALLAPARTEPCPNDLPSSDSCSSSVPSYAQEVTQVLTAACVPCHSAGGIEHNRPFDNYSFLTTSAQRRAVLTQVYSCKMPPSCAPSLSPEGRQTLLRWLVCNGPEN